MALNFHQQIDGLTGLVAGTNPTTAEVTAFLKDGVIDVTERMVLLNPREVTAFMRETAELADNGFNPGTSKIITVLRETGTNNDWRACEVIPPELQSRVKDKSSIYYASKFSPVYFITQNSNVHVVPEPSGTGHNKYKILYINNVPEEGDGTELQYDSEEIKWFPKDKVYLVVLYAAVRCLGHVLASKEIEPELALPIAPETISLSTTSTSLPIMGAIEPFVGLQDLGDVNVDFTEVGSFPTFNSPILSYSDAPSIGSFSISSTAPVAPSSPNISSGGISAAAASFTGIALPVYIPPTISMASVPSIGTLSISAMPPIAPDLLDRLNSKVDFSSRVESHEPTYTEVSKPIFSTTASISGLDFSMDFSGITVPTVPVFNTPIINEGGITDPTFTVPPLPDLNYSDINDWINTEEDAEMSQARVQEIQTKIQQHNDEVQAEVAKWNNANAILQKDLNIAQQNAQFENEDNSNNIQSFASDVQRYQAEVQKVVQQHQAEQSLRIQGYQAEVSSDLQLHLQEVNTYNIETQNNVNKYQKELAIYQSEVQKAMQDANLSSQVDQNAIQKYQTSITEYQNVVNKEVQEYSNNLNKDIQMFQIERNTQIQKYQSDIQNEMQVMQNGLNVYQAETQRTISNAQLLSQEHREEASLDLQAQIQDYASSMQKYSAELQEYQANIQKEVVSYSTKLDKDIAVWNQKRQTELGQFTQEIQAEVARVSNGGQDYAQKVGKALQKYQAETGYDVAKHQADLQNRVQLFNSNLTKISTSFTNDLQKYSAETQNINSENQAKLAKYQGEVQKYGAESNTIIQEFNSKLQRYNLNYGWMQSRQSELKQQYETAFQMMAPGQPQEA